jgi:hypothetical protein
VSLALAWADWAWHLGVSPGRQMDLAARAAQAVSATWHAARRRSPGRCAADDDPRFRHPAWAQLALQRDARGLPQCRGLLARRVAGARHDGATTPR